MRNDHPKKRFLRFACYGAATLALSAAVACGAAKDKLKNAVGQMNFTGTVVKAGTTDPIKDAQVNLIPLLDKETLETLVEYKQIPDGKGGKAKRVRVKLDKVQAFVDSNGDVVKTTTDASGKFKVEAPANAYLIYTYGPGDKPGTTGDAFGPHFWGINPDTGELSLDHLIGKDLKPDQANDKIQLSGGPVPPAPPPAATPQPIAQPVVLPPPPATPPPPVAAEPTPTTPPATLPPGNVIPPTPAPATWVSIKLTHKDGFIGTGGAMQVDAANLKDAERSLELTAELAADQTDPVYLVLQKGFDTNQVSGCEGTTAVATTRVYPVGVNGKTITYQLVPPGPYYKLFFAKKAVQTKDGEAPTTVEVASDTLTVGKKECANAAPERPFMATLAWDAIGDIDIHVFKYDALKLKDATTAEQIGESLVDQAMWTRRQGTTLTLDVDNVYGYGPENNGESKGETNPQNFCYFVQLNYYSGSGTINSTVDVTYVTVEAGKKVVKQLPHKIEMKERGEWKSVGSFGPSQCSKLLNPPSTPENVIDYPPLSSCVRNYGCSLKGDEPGKYAAKVTLEGTSFKASDPIKVTYADMPGASGDWITIVPKGQEDNSWCSWQWSSGTTGTQWYGSLPPGEYEVRMYYKWSGGQCEVIGRTPFTVTP